MGRTIQQGRERAHGHAPKRAAHDRAEEQSIANITGHQGGYNIRHVHADNLYVQPLVFEKTLFQSYSGWEKGHIRVRYRDAYFVRASNLLAWHTAD